MSSDILTREAVYTRGLNWLFSHNDDRGPYGTDYSNDKELRGVSWKDLKAFYVSNPNMIFNYFKNFNGVCKGNYLSLVNNNNEYSLYSIKEWRGVLDKEVECLEDEDSVSSRLSSMIYDYRNEWSYLLDIAEMKPGFNWTPLFNAASVMSISGTDIFERILCGFCKMDKESFAESMSDTLFDKNSGWGHSKRSVYYKAFVSSGLLDKKTARKIRSDASSKASLSGLKALFKNKDLYEENFEELLVQFVDTRYDDVVYELAENLPFHMLSYIMGTNYHYAKNKIERRMDDYYREKENE